MVSIADFEVGEPLFTPVLNNSGRYTGEIDEVTISKVGRKYITVSKYSYDGTKLAPSERGEFFEQQGDSGYKNIYFATRSLAQDEVDRDRLMLEIRRKLALPEDNFSIKQIREIAGILDIK